MKSLEPNVVVVDDKFEEVDGLIGYYHNQGIGCKYFNANVADGDDYPENCYADVTLVFLDLYYTEGPLQNGFDPELPASWVRTIVNPNSFYILVLWTKDPAQADGVLGKLAEVNLRPYLTIIEGKDKYATETPTKYDYTGLLDSINKKLDNVPAIQEVIIWKNTVKKTANIVLGGLVCEDANEFTNKLKKIIVSHGGKNIQQATCPIEKRLTLFEALNNVLISNALQFASDVQITSGNKTGLYDLSNMEDVPVDKQLNSWFHFMLKKDLTGAVCPGVVAKNNSPFLQKYYTLRDDVNMEKLLAPQKEENKPELLIEDIVLIITRPCDFAQKKYGKNLKLLSGLAIKNPIRKSEAVEISGKNPDSIIILDHLITQNNTDLTLIFDLRYSFSIPEKEFLRKMENIHILNKELLSDIQVHYSNYVSRLGYTKIF